VKGSQQLGSRAGGVGVLKKVFATEPDGWGGGKDHRSSFPDQIKKKKTWAFGEGERLAGEMGGKREPLPLLSAEKGKKKGKGRGAFTNPEKRKTRSRGEGKRRAVRHSLPWGGREKGKRLLRKLGIHGGGGGRSTSPSQGLPGKGGGKRRRPRSGDHGKNRLSSLKKKKKKQQLY